MSLFDEVALRNRLIALSSWKQAAFLTLLCDRMMPNARQFSRDTGFSISICSECLEKAWEYLSDGARANYQVLSERCLENAPDMDEFTHKFASAALDAVLSVSKLMSFLQQPNIDLIVEAVTLAFDTIYLYIPTTDASSDDEIIKHPLMQQELKREEDDLRFVEAISTDIDTPATVRLKDRAREAAPLLSM